MALYDMTSLGRHPFDMFDAANELESIANNEYVHQPFVDVSWSYPKFMAHHGTTYEIYFLF